MARPPELTRLLQARSRDEEIDLAALVDATRGAVRDVVRQQQAVGITVLNDGEYSKVGFAYYLKDRLSGYELEKQPSPRSPFPGEAVDFPAFYTRPYPRGGSQLPRALCVGPVSWKDFSLVEQDINNLRSASQGLGGVADIFMTSPSPTTAANFQPNRYYATDEEYIQAVADALKREYRAIVEAGFILQVDMPFGTARSSLLELGSDELQAATRSSLARNVEVLNYTLAGLPQEQIRVHICFGSDEGPHHRDPELGDVVDVLLTIDAAGLTLVSASGRHEHEWRVWEDVRLPEGKVVVAGVIDHTTNIIEHPLAVADRIARYARAIGRRNLIAGVDCGFSPGAGVEDYRVDSQIMWAKLKSLVDGARIASGQLWP